MKDTLRIIVLGDEGVGKSSLISAFVSQCFPEKVRGGKEGGWKGFYVCGRGNKKRQPQHDKGQDGRRDREI